MNSSLSTVDLRKLNSATKYPPILTYHEMDARTGMLQEERTCEFTERVIGTEKVDGTNTRVIVLPSGEWVVGSREDLLTAQGDRVFNQSLGIVASLRREEGLLGLLAQALRAPDRIVTAYLEVYGQKETAHWKNYSSDGTTGWRLFDVSRVRVSTLDMEIERIASWRQRGSQEFVDEDTLVAFAGLTGVPLTPRLFNLEAQWLPKTVEETAPFLALHSTTTKVAVGESPAGRSEGIVLRSPDRRTIVKARHADYAGTLRRRAIAEKAAEKAAWLTQEGMGA